jgi:hypothetical protein
MASVPDHPFWLEVLKEALARALTPPTISNPAITPRYNSGLGGFSSVAAGVWGSAGSRSRQLLNKLQQLWEATPWHDKANAVLWSTGPMLLTAVYKVRCCVVLDLHFIYVSNSACNGTDCAVVDWADAAHICVQGAL